MMNIQNLGSKESVGLNIKGAYDLKATGIFTILLSRVLKATLQEQSSKQSLREVRSEAAVRRCSSK